MNLPEFDLKRAIRVNPSPFKAFDAGDEMEQLETVLQNEEVHPDQPLLIVEHQAGVIALDRQEMSYHHVAQGELRGKPWLVVF